MTMEEYALDRVEETRRELMALNAKVELGTDIGYELSEILVRAINEIEILLDREDKPTKIEITDIIWDVDYKSDLRHLPKSVVIEDPDEDLLEDIDGYADGIANYLSDEYGYLVESFVVNVIDRN